MVTVGMRSVRRVWIGACSLVVGCSALLAASPAAAELRVTAIPVLGPNTPTVNSWLECGVRLDNDDSRPAKGTLELTSPTGYGSEEVLVTRAPFAVGAGATVTVRMPTRGFAYSGGGALRLTVRGERGEQLSALSVSVGGQLAPFLLDVTDPPRLAGALRDVPVAVTYDPASLSSYSSTKTKPQLLTGTVRTDPATGDPVLPERAAGYAGATLVLLRSDQLARLAGPALDALANYVLAGGSLAVPIARPEDLRNPTLNALVGGEIATAQLPTEARRTPAKPPEGSDPGKSATKGKGPKDVWPGEELGKTLTGYQGGNLGPTLYGASASYGLGEVHILAFDPTAAPGVDDLWARGRMVDLIRHAWDRRASLVAPQGLVASNTELDLVRKELDPNENSRWAIIIAALLLTAYSVLAGPVNFLRASKRGHPLRALAHLPFYAAAGLAAVVLLGIGAKGWSGKSRHLTIVESAAGMTKASAKRYRGFFTSASRSLTVRASDSQSVLDTALESRGGATRSLVVDRDGVRLVGVSTMPWETVVVREDGFLALGAGISLLREPDGDVTIVNRTARDLRGLVLVIPHQPGKSARKVVFLQKLKDGAKAKGSEGKEISGFTPWTSTVGGLSHSDLVPLRDELDRQSRGLFSAWVALGQASGRQVDWWPEDVPVLLAQLDGGEGLMSDSGMAIERDRVLVRVVGWGGLP